MAGLAAALTLLLLLTACSAGTSDENETAAISEPAKPSAAFPLDGTVFGAPASELAKAGDHPRPAAQFDLTADELARVGAELAEDYSLKDFRQREIDGVQVAPPSFRAAKVDLDGDGIDEILTLSAGYFACGSGGCGFRIYSAKDDRVRKVSGSAITRMPIGVTDATTNGWRNITVFICGGGLDPCGRALLKFDGSRYPPNPTMPP